MGGHPSFPGAEDIRENLWEVVEHQQIQNREKNKHNSSSPYGEERRFAPHLVGLRFVCFSWFPQQC
jgi:hypothetical protein